MEIRELLQKELWSKKTSRKILSVAGRVLRVVEVLLVVFVVWYLVNALWLTPSERTAGRIALAKLDALQRFDGMSEDEYGGEYKQAETMVHAAEEAARTGRDNFIATSLSTYLMFTDMRRQEQQTRMALSNSSNEHLRSFGLQTCPESVTGNEFESAVLHQALR
jgi:hypothetical protein